jgi:membrane protease YdiL (CAAX protease family)
MSAPTLTTNRRLAIPYLLPYAAYVAIASLPADWLSREQSYLLRAVLVTGALGWGWRRYVHLLGPRPAAGSVAVGAAGGLLGLGLWVAMLQSLVGSAGEPWEDLPFALRLAVASTLVPIFEELAMRGYVLGFFLQWQSASKAGARDPFGEALDRRSIHELPAGAASPLAVAASTLVFMAGHSTVEYPAAFAYGLLMAALWIVRKDLLSCIVAHAVTNLGLGLYVRATGSWALW